MLATSVQPLAPTSELPWLCATYNTSGARFNGQHNTQATASNNSQRLDTAAGGELHGEMSSKHLLDSAGMSVLTTFGDSTCQIGNERDRWF